MKKQFVRVLGCSAGLLAASLLSMSLLGMETRVASAQGIEQQAPITDTMPMDHSMPMSDTMRAMGGMGDMGDMGDMAQMMEMMKGMEQRMSQMEERMTQMQGSMPMGGQDSGKGQGGMMGQGGDRQHMRMMMHMMMMMQMMDMMDESSGMPCDMMQSMMGQGAAGQGQGAGPQAGAASTDERTAELGGISLKATPVNLANPSGETLDFSVDLESQDQALNFDVAPLAKLMVGSEEVAASSWKVNFDHGHHVNGTLSFPLADVAAALTPGAKVMVHIEQKDGGGNAMLDWDVTE